MEEGLLPHIRALDDPAQMEEERRLCYVGITRARERLYLTRARRRFMFGQVRGNPASRFLRDVPDEDVVTPVGAPVRSAEDALDGRGLRAAAAARRDDDQTEQRAFAPGERVRHNTFGVGTVIGCQQMGGDMQVTVAFQGQGVKKLLQSFARLESANEESA